MKRFLALALAVLMLLGLAAFAETATEATEEEAVISQKEYLGTFDLVDNDDPVDSDALAAKDTLVQTTVSAIPLNTAKTSPVAYPKLVANGVGSSTTDDELRMFKQMGINHLEISFKDDELDYETMKTIVERFRNFEEGGFDILLATNGKLQKNTSIHLALEDRDAEIERTKQFMVNLSRLGIDTMAIAWQPFGISRSDSEPLMIHGASAGASDMEQILNFPLKGERLYTREEMWETFEYFIDAILPTCEETGVRMALHPNDPPVPYLEGVGSLIITADDYRRAFEIANDSPYLGMKLCTGCWLEGGTLFTDDMLGDIDEFVRRGKVFEVHFRNVSAPLDADYSGYFEETLAQDGYADMYEIMKQLIRSGYNGAIFCDHSHRSVNSELLGSRTNMATSNAFIQGLIYAARNEVGKELLGVQ